MTKQLVFDTETTGIDLKIHAIHQLSGKIVIDGVFKESFDFRIAPHPDAQIDEEALKVSNVTKEQIMAYPANILVHRQLLGVLGKYVQKFNKLDKFHLIGYNSAHFDVPFFRAFFNLCGDTFYGSWFWADNIDVMVLASDYLQEERVHLPNFQLRTVAAYLGIPVDETKLHDAQYDLYLTYEIYKIVSHKKPIEPAPAILGFIGSPEAQPDLFSQPKVDTISKEVEKETQLDRVRRITEQLRKEMQ